MPNKESIIRINGRISETSTNVGLYNNWKQAGGEQSSNDVYDGFPEFDHHGDDDDDEECCGRYIEEMSIRSRRGCEKLGKAGKRNDERS